MFKFITVIFIFGLSACNHTKTKGDTKILDFGAFTIETPQLWTKIKQQGIDGYVGRIAIDNKDTLDFELGPYSYDLHENEPTIIDSIHLKDIDTNNANYHSIIFVKHIGLVDFDKYRKDNISWDTIDGKKAKIVYPIKSGIGFTGVFIDTLWHTNLNVDRFVLSGTNLTPENEKKVLQVLRTLKFHKK